MVHRRSPGHQGGVGQAPHLGAVDGDPLLTEAAHQVRAGVVPVAEAVDHRGHLAHHAVDGQGQDRPTLRRGGDRRPHQRHLQGPHRGGDGTGLSGGQRLHALAVVERRRMLEHLARHPIEQSGRCRPDLWRARERRPGPPVKAARPTSPSVVSSSAAASAGRPSGRRRERSPCPNAARALANRIRRRPGTASGGSEGTPVMTGSAGWRGRRTPGARRGQGGGPPYVELVDPRGEVVGRDRFPIPAPDVGQPDAGVERRRPGHRGHLPGRFTVPLDELTSPHHRIGLVQPERDQPPSGTLGDDPLNGRPADEVDPRSELAGEPETGLHRVVVGRQVRAEGTVSLVQPKGVDRVVAGVGEREVGTSIDQGLVHAHGEFGTVRRAPSPTPRRR